MEQSPEVGSVSAYIPTGLSGSGPGIDPKLNDKLGQIHFSGSDVSFSRLVHVIFASKEVYVAIDALEYNIYVVDRAKKLSLGCLLTAEFEELPDNAFVMAYNMAIQLAPLLENTVVHLSKLD